MGALADRADILIENCKVGGLARYGLDWLGLEPQAVQALRDRRIV